MKRLGLFLIGLALTLTVFMAPAFAAKPDDTGPPSCAVAPNNPNCVPVSTTTTVAPPTTTTISESPGANCSHGVNDDGTCRPDPNEHGQDCDEHGVPNPAGNDGNEDHCLPTPTETTSTPPPVTTTTTTAVETTTTEAPPTSTTTVTETTDTTTTSSTTSSSPAPSDDEGNGPNEKPEKDVEKPGKLAFTGIEDVVPVAGLALALLTGGSGLMWLGRKRDDE